MRYNRGAPEALMLLLALLLQTPAHAGSGPWVIGEGLGTVYVGLESQRLNRLAITVDGDRSVIDVGEGLSTIGVKAIGTLGLTPRIEIQAQVPFWHVQANRPDSQLCTDIGAAVGREACETTTSFGILEFRGKGLLLDEFFGAPFSLAIGPEFRWGELTQSTRERITNVGEGGLDAGGFVSIGRTGAIGDRGYWSGYLELVGRYRFPLRDTFPASLGDRNVPGSEFGATAEWIVAPRTRIAFGPLVTTLWRPFGVDWGDTDLTDPDRLGALRVFSLRAGGTVAVRGPRNAVATLTVLRTVYAENNPTDVLSVNVGVQTLLTPRRRSDDDN